MIQLIDVTRYHEGSGGPNILYAGINAVFPPRSRVGILAGQGTGKSSLARLLAGIEQPNTGVVLRHGRVSWPLGFVGLMHIGLSGAENVAITARMLGESPSRAVAFCRAFTGMGAEINRPVRVYSPGAKAKLGMALSLAFQFDFYIADENIGAGDEAFRDRCTAMLEQRLATAGLIFLSRNPAQAARFCDTLLVLANSQLVEANAPDQAASLLERAQHGTDVPENGGAHGQ